MQNPDENLGLEKRIHPKMSKPSGCKLPIYARHGNTHPEHSERGDAI